MLSVRCICDIRLSTDKLRRTTMHVERLEGSADLLTMVDLDRMKVSTTLDDSRRGKLGQFMTPSSVARFMASQFGNIPSAVNLLDAGAGVGTLTAAFVHAMCRRNRKPREINVTAFEVEPSLSQSLRITLNNCKEECSRSVVAPLLNRAASGALENKLSV
jgi:predicted RNA methylase